jgi:hypothetical protein
MSFKHSPTAFSPFSCAENKTHPSESHGHKTCKCKFPHLPLKYFSSHLSWVEGWLEIGWVVSFDGFECFFLFVIIGDRNKLGSTLFSFILTSLQTNTQFICGFSCTLLNSTQVLLNHFLTHHGSLKT